jgi:hypothetical protein
MVPYEANCVVDNRKVEVLATEQEKTEYAVAVYETTTTFASSYRLF